MDCSFTLQRGWEAASELMDRGKAFTAVIAMSDTVAMGAMKALHDRGVRVPQDVSVVGFDGVEQGAFVRPLATMRQPADDIARITLECLRRCAAASRGGMCC